ncbi:MAG: hypothetical protein Q4F67_00530 [Propionibacteriaceae bacterium]|nr:hypothetical protein [Propionibacteriaceae bacterium]
MKKVLARCGGLALIAGLLVGGAATADALTTYTSYNTTVGKFNGNGYTGTQRKSVSDYNGTIKSGIVGGNYQVDAVLQQWDGSRQGTWVRIDDGTTALLHNRIPAGNSTRVRFSNDWGTRVDVQVSGSFRAY